MHLVQLYGKLYRYSKLYVLISVCKFWPNIHKKNCCGLKSWQFIRRSDSNEIQRIIFSFFTNNYFRQTFMIVTFFSISREVKWFAASGPMHLCYKLVENWDERSWCWAFLNSRRIQSVNQTRGLVKISEGKKHQNVKRSLFVLNFYIRFELVGEANNDMPYQSLISTILNKERKIEMLVWGHEMLLRFILGYFRHFNLSICSFFCDHSSY